MIGKRKLVASSVLLVVITALLVFDKLDGDQYVEILNWLVVGFGIANGAEHVAKRGAG